MKSGIVLFWFYGSSMDVFKSKSPQKVSLQFTIGFILILEDFKTVKRLLIRVSHCKTCFSG